MFGIRVRNVTASLGAIALAAAGCAFSACSSASEDNGHGAALIGGRPALDTDVPATLMLGDSCSAAKVGPRHILTAAHCVTGAKASRYRVGAREDLLLSHSMRRDGVQPRWQAVTIDAVHVDARWIDECAYLPCNMVHVTGRMDMSDVAVIVVREEIELLPVAAVDLSPVERGDKVIVAGFGCEGASEWTGPRLKVANVTTLPFEASVHAGSFMLPADRESGLVDRMGGLYFLTPGPAFGAPASWFGGGGDPDAFAPNMQNGGLCPGDSGGPVYRDDGHGLVIVGVNANYTFATSSPSAAVNGFTYSYGGNTVTNWHTRVDGRTRGNVGYWLEQLGVRTTCSRGGCSRPGP